MRINQAMSNDNLQVGTDDCILVSGPLTFDNVERLSERGKKLLEKSKVSPCVFDLSGVTQAGSAGVSLLLSWARYARAQRIEVMFSNLPPGLTGVAQVSGIDQILPIKQNQAV